MTETAACYAAEKPCAGAKPKSERWPSAFLGSQVPEWVEAAATIVRSAAFFLIVLMVFVVVTHLVGYEIEFDPDKKLPRIFARKQREAAQLGVAFERLAEVGKGLRGVVEASDADVDHALYTWFQSLCMSIAWTLATENSEVYRVAIWTKDSSQPDILRALAWHMGMAASQRPTTN